MNVSSTKPCWRTTIVLLVLVISVVNYLPIESNATDQIPEPIRETRFLRKGLLRVWIPHITINSGFNAHRIYSKDSLLSAFFPRLSGMAGIAVGLGGQRRYPMWKLEFSGGLYWSPLEYSAQGVTGEAVVRGLDLDFSASYGIHPINQSGQMRPVAFVGLSLDYLDIERGSIDSEGVDSDMTFSGGSVKAGGGFDFILSDLVVINGRLIYRWYEFSAVAIGQEWFSVVPNIRAGGFNFVLGLTFYYR